MARLFLVFEAVGQAAPLSSDFPDLASPYRASKSRVGERTFAAFFQSPSTSKTTDVKKGVTPEAGRSDAEETTPQTLQLVSGVASIELL